MSDLNAVSRFRALMRHVLERDIDLFIRWCLYECIGKVLYGLG